MEARAFFISKSFPFRRRFAAGTIALESEAGPRSVCDPGSESETEDNWQAGGTSSNSLQHPRACAHFSHIRTATQAATALLPARRRRKNRARAC